MLYANPDEYYAQGKAPLNPQAEEAYNQACEISYPRQDGSSFISENVGSQILDEEGNLLGNIGLIRDISARKRAEQALRESEARFRMMTDRVPIMIWMSGVAGLGTYLNPCWLDFTGRSLEQDLGNGWTEIIHPQDRQDAFNTYISAFEARQTFQMQYRLRRGDGEYRWLLSTGIPRFNPDGNFAGYIGSCTDITEIKQAKEQLTQANIELEQRVAERTAELTIAKEAAETANQSKNSFIAH